MLTLPRSKRALMADSNCRSAGADGSVGPGGGALALPALGGSVPPAKAKTRKYSPEQAWAYHCMAQIAGKALILPPAQEVPIAARHHPPSTRKVAL
jgi:hypothetical protein